MTHDAQQVFDFGIRHLNELRMPYGFAASEAQTGYYSALFGRDSLWMLIFLLDAYRISRPCGMEPWLRQVAQDIIRALSVHQCKGPPRDAIDAQRGKIIHEYRETTDARLEKTGIKFQDGRSYSGFDQTFLFVIAYCTLVIEFDSLEIIKDAKSNMEEALSWIETYADEDSDGLFEYRRRDERNHLNQSWRDSFDSVVNADRGCLPPQPIAWLSVQAYGYRAFCDAARFFEKTGESRRARELRAKAGALKKKVRRMFWLDDEDCLTIALDANKQRIQLVSSDAGHALWSGLVRAEDRDALVRRLMQKDIMTDYGLRSLSSASRAYAPFLYHRGNVWPFDNAIFAIGLLAHDYRTEARRVIESVAAAIMKIGSAVELYVVLDGSIFVDPEIKEPYLLARRKPVQRNSTQGWTAAGLVFMAAALSHLNGTKLDFRPAGGAD